MNWVTPDSARVYCHQVPFFEERDLEAMFAAFDVTGRGHITIPQYDQGTSATPRRSRSVDAAWLTPACPLLHDSALINLGIDQPTLRLPESINAIDKSLFVRSL